MKHRETCRTKVSWIYLSFVMAVILGMSTTGLSAEGVWTKKADMPTARTGLVVAVVDDIIYAIGGARSGIAPTLAAVEAYDPETNTWMKRSDIPTASVWLSAAVMDGKIYVMGGEKADQVFAQVVEVYDPATDTWEKAADMPTRRDACSTNVVSGIIYVIGGYPGGNDNTKTVEAYDPIADAWTKKTDMPTGRYIATSAAVNGVIYVIAGQIAANIRVPTVEAYNPATDTWAGMNDMPFLFRNWSIGNAPVIDNRIYMAGSQGMASYDPISDTWTMEPGLITPRNGASFAVVNDKIYAIGGAVSWGNPGLATVEEFTPEGWPFQEPAAVSPQHKLPTLWGTLRLVRSGGRQSAALPAPIP